MEKNMTPRGCCMEPKPSATLSGSPFQRELAAAPGRSLNKFASRKKFKEIKTQNHITGAHFGFECQLLKENIDVIRSRNW